MLDTENGGNAPDAAPGVRLDREPESLTRNRQKPQRNAERGIIPPMPPIDAPPGFETMADWRARLVSEGYFLRIEIVEPRGPIALIGNPLVAIGYHALGTAAWVCPTRWQFPGRPFEFRLLPVGKDVSLQVVNWAIRLRDALKKAALAEQDRRSRIRDERVRERLSFLDRELPQ